ncbi:hypothetical protein ABO04_03980 [Nitrosomonas sp. HPC101]|uniref:hypothetical protein n=1 Tax=Nitrosomonas sp. HPC101 TaxID=1658667 RepID=UPI00136ED927|nr:hypothetical protein [Nitrosomonas sp. HPC101]MXS85092.1 hypothetical protein [Nitrosomonas sp. HPC101]
MKYQYLLIACAAALALSACEEKKSLDGHSMEKPPPSAFMERDSSPDVDTPEGMATSSPESKEEKQP